MQKTLRTRPNGKEGKNGMKNVKYSVCERMNRVNNVIRECEDWQDANEFCKAAAEQWAKDGLIVDDIEGNQFVAHDTEDFDLVHNYLICVEYVPQKGAIDPTIKGYEFVKDVVFACGEERTGCDLLFAVRRDCDGDYLRGLCEVAENKGYEAYKALQAKYPFDTHIIWHGCVRTLREGAAIMPSGGDIIEFYWS